MIYISYLDGNIYVPIVHRIRFRGALSHSGMSRGGVLLVDMFFTWSSFSASRRHPHITHAIVILIPTVLRVGSRFQYRITQ